MYVIVWKFRPKPGSKREFEKAYGPDGAWARFFRRGEGYLGTELLRDSRRKDSYTTIDRWTSKSVYERFRGRWRTEYAALDRRFEKLTEHEALIGAYIVLGRPQPKKG